MYDGRFRQLDKLLQMKLIADAVNNCQTNKGKVLLILTLSILTRIEEATIKKMENLMEPDIIEAKANE
jgi:hypothetical protein